ncbi:MAG: glycosyltransferase [Candidatus Obscuribacterales bacterium]
MFVLSLVLIAITIVAAWVQTISFRRLCEYVETELGAERPDYQPKASVILPCKGLDPGFRENISRLLEQRYRNFEVIFAVAEESDAAYSHLQELVERYSDRARIIVAGVSPNRAQKLNNQLSALDLVAEDSEVLVFVDSDVIAREDFLDCLVRPLADQAVGVTTGYRFYISSSTNLPAVLRSLWNRMSAWEMASNHAFAWGGAMAVRKEIFARAGVKIAWERAADDDLSLTTCIKALGLAVHFVPQCLVASDGNASLKEIIDWTNRQLILTKVYYRPLWIRAITRALVMLVWLGAVTAAAIGTLVYQDSACLSALIAGATILPVEAYFLVRARRLWERVLADRGQHLKESLWSSCMAIPLAHVVLPFLTLFSVLTNKIQWRGVTYELRSPREILVVSQPQG